MFGQLLANKNKITTVKNSDSAGIALALAFARTESNRKSQKKKGYEAKKERG
jgi:hypothetical protein